MNTFSGIISFAAEGRRNADNMLAADVLQRSIINPGTAEAWEPVFARLDAGEPLVLGVFGASVAQNGG